MNIKKKTNTQNDIKKCGFFKSLSIYSGNNETMILNKSLMERAL